MHLVPLSLHRQKFQAGKPAPFDIFDIVGRLLLARGHTIESQGQLDKLIDREARVDTHELEDITERIAGARPEQLPGYWDNSIRAMDRVLRATPGADFIKSLDKASRPLLALIERDPDLAILQAVRLEEVANQSMYASRHAVHVATAATLAAKRLGWSAEQVQRALRVALTMNMSCLELQNRLANQVTPITPTQRGEILTHPERSAQMLEAAGVKDGDWLDAVRQHHEDESGTGYPRGLSHISEVAQLVRCADSFTAKLSPRAQRPALLADSAARLQYSAGKGNPVTAALIKEFGLYPPGCYVRLASGEVGVVMRRGSGVNTPIVAVLVNRSGEPLIRPLRRDTAKGESSIVAAIPPSALRVQVGLEELLINVGR